MFTTNNDIVVLNLPEQVERNRQDIDQLIDGGAVKLPEYEQYKTDVDGLKTSVDELKTEVQDHDGEITQANNAIFELEKRVTLYRHTILVAGDKLHATFTVINNTELAMDQLQAFYGSSGVINHFELTGMLLIPSEDMAAMTLFISFGEDAETTTVTYLYSNNDNFTHGHVKLSDLGSVILDDSVNRIN